ncbi:hypothetical protein THRCLA_23018 [Thraustotheca clavata]|uniref:Uncharacterized protein n=1 Tax=Thraustotheca clavata TaxID=74557 RepID=A0A1V9YIN1_9STRA|nr:hypothetical protein THRCLA_23018 [Thraustotheca clavata]
MADLIASAAKELGVQALKKLRRSNAKESIIDGKQLLVISPDHWMFNALCQYKRYEHQLIINKVRNATKLPVEAMKTRFLTQLLPGCKHEQLNSFESTEKLSELVLIIASVFSELMPDYEPLLVELALVHCIRVWSREKVDKEARSDVNTFEGFLQNELNGDNASQWFCCQFFMDSLDVMTLAPFFYKERITHQPVKDLISMCLAESHINIHQYSSLLIEHMAKEKNKAALNGWKVWVGETLVTIGTPRRSASQLSLQFLSDVLMNPTQMDSDKLGYFPIGVAIKGFASTEFKDLFAYVLRRTKSINWYFPGYFYTGTS